MIQMMKDSLTIMKYNIISYFRYPANILWMIGAPVVFSIIGLLLVDLLGAERFISLIGGNQSGLYYVLVGFSVFSFSNYAWQSNSKIESEKLTGTSKTNFTLPINKISYVYGLSIGGLITSGSFNILILVAMIFINKLSPIQLLNFAILLILSAFVFLGISLIISSISFAFIQLGSLTNIVTFGLQMITGMIIPLRVFPEKMQQILQRMPTSLAIDSIRSQLLSLEPMDSLEIELILLAIYAVGLNLLGYLLCKKALKIVKTKGTIDVY
jgi:ABC transporter, permease protein